MPVSCGRSAEVTAVVTCFNYGRYLGDAVDSLLGQERGAPRVLVIDDGSTDPATNVALDALPVQVEVVRQANAGVCNARNAGLARVSTPRVIFLDADDRMPAGALARLAAALDADPAAGFAYGHHRFFDGWSGVWEMPPFDPLRLLDRHQIGPTALARVDMLRAIGGYDPEFAHFEDWELWLSALEAGWRGVRVDAVTFEYRRHGTSKHGADRRRYRSFRRQLKRKHAALFARRAELAGSSGLGPLGRAVYRCYWGPRPVPAAVEGALYRAFFSRRVGRGPRASGASSSSPGR